MRKSRYLRDMKSEPPTIVWHSELPQELYAALGRVAHSTALLDAMLTELAEDLSGHGEAWVFVAGQSTDWLIQTCRVLLDVSADPHKKIYGPQFHDTMKQHLDRAGELRVHRNRVIHGTWSKVPYAEQPLPRPWGEEPPGVVLWVSRDRQRRSFEEQAMTVQDVERLAAEIELVTAGVIRTWRAVTPHEPDWPPFRRWHISHPRESQCLNVAQGSAEHVERS